MRTLFAVAVLTGAAAAAGYLAVAPAPPGPSRLERVPSMDSTPGGNRQRESQRYRETLRSSNIIQADEAERSGDSFMSVPEGLPEQTRRPESVLPPPDSENDAPGTDVSAEQAAELVAAAADNSARRDAAVRASSPAAQGKAGSHPYPSAAGHKRNPADAANPFHDAILRQMSAAAQAMEIVGLSSVELISGADVRSKARRRQPEHTPDKRIQTAGSPDFIAAGTILQGETVTLIDSDVPAPVTVRMTSGPIAGGALIGNFAANIPAGGVVVEFNRLSLPAGMEIPVQAMALDQFTLGSAVQGQVDARPVKRYGPMLLSSFISGFAESAARPATRFLSGANGIVAAVDKPTVRDSLIAGAGQAAGAAASDLAEAAPKTPRIRVEPGEPISVLFLSPVIFPQRSPE